MNSSIASLTEVASREEKLILGLMSGTSLDGLDLALCRISGTGRDTRLELSEFTTSPYDDAFRKKLQRIVSVEQCSLQEVCLMHSYVGDYHGDLIGEALKEWGVDTDELDCIASHGQSIYHAPISRHRREEFSNATLQIGDGDHIARKTGVLTLSDFRQKHTAAGGEGAPMAALVDRMLFGSSEENRLLLNIGGIANFTYLPFDRQAYSLTTDTGPGNTLLDGAALSFLGRPYDSGGSVAASGDADEGLLEALKSDGFFSLDMPKTTGPELFNGEYVQQAMSRAGIDRMAPRDLLATLSRFSAETIAECIRQVHGSNAALHIYLSGGGMHNGFLIATLKKLLNGAMFHSFREIGFDPDAKEAACFAVFANEMLSGEGFRLDTRQGGAKVNFGKISFPK